MNNPEDFNVNKPIPGNIPVPVPNTTIVPYIFVGLVHVVFPSGNSYVGTGTLIGKGSDNESQYVLTCAHNLFSVNDGGRAASIKFIRAYNDPHSPFEAIEAESCYYPYGYENIDRIESSESNVNLDYAIIKLKKKITTGDVLPRLVVKDDNELYECNVRINGYGYFGEHMSAARGKLVVVAAGYLRYPISTRKQAAGSAIVLEDGISIIGIHTRATDENLNEGIRITEAVKYEIHSWMR